MQRNNYITAILLALLISSGLIYHILNFRYNSAFYTLMRIGHAIADNNSCELDMLCNLPAFTVSFDKQLTYLAGNSVVPIDKQAVNLLKSHSDTHAYQAYITGVFHLFGHVNGDLIYQQEFVHTDRRRVSQYYKIRGSDYTIILMLGFSNNAGTFRLENLENIFLIKK